MSRPKPTSKHIKAIEAAIDYFGNQTELAKALSVSRQLVNDWIKGRIVISVEQARRIANMTRNQITFYDLRPDVKIKDKKDLQW